MTEVYNLFAHEWHPGFDRDGYRHRALQLGARLGGEQLGATLYELPPGEKVCPYHCHIGNEEWLLVVAGRPTLRTPDGEREFVPGDVVCFPDGERGAHSVENRTSEHVRVLIASTKRLPSISVYPDSDKIGVRTSDERPNFRRGDAVDYWEGEA